MCRSLLKATFVVGMLTLAVLPLAAETGAAAVASDLRVDHEVDGDAVVLLGDLFLENGAEVHGDAVAVLGRVHVADGATVHGRVVGVRSLASLDLDPMAADAAGSTRAGLILLALGAWLFATSLAASLAPKRVHEGVRQVRELGWRVVVYGVFAAATFLAALVAVLGLGPTWGVPLSALLMALFIGMKIVGLTVIGAWLGTLLLNRRGLSRWPASVEVFVGVLLLLGLRVIPLVGGWAWNSLSLVALGAGVFTLVAQRTTIIDRVEARAK